MGQTMADNSRFRYFPGRISTIPMASTVTVLTLTTAATGSNWTSFSSQECDAIDIVNNTGTTLEYRRSGAGYTIPIPTGSARLVIGIDNASDISVRRSDTSNTQVTVTAEAMKL
jgi:hypothetical protein